MPDVDTENLARVVATLERQAASLMDAKREYLRAVDAINRELTDLLHARHTLQGAVDAVIQDREEPEQVRH